MTPDEELVHLDAELERLQGFLKAIQVIRELSPRSEDILLATGELLSARLLALAEERGRPLPPAERRRLLRSLSASRGGRRGGPTV